MNKYTQLSLKERVLIFEGKIEIARAMLQKGIAIQTISELTELSIEEIKSL